MAKQRHSTPELPAPRPKLTPEQEARQAAENGFRQFDRLRQLIRDGISRYEEGKFQLRISTLTELAKLAVEGTVDAPGHLRRGPVKIEGSRHIPPDADRVMHYLEEMSEYVNSNFDRSAWHLAAYVMWRLNWIHPFEDGNGRTARAVAYLLLCVRSKFELPGTTTVPELIAQDKEPYYQALEAADQASIKDPSVVDVSHMERLLRDLLIRQLDAAAGGSPRTPQIEIGPDKSPEPSIPPVKIGIMTIRQDEEAAILKRIASTTTLTGPRTTRKYHIGTVGHWQVAVCRQLLPGNVASAGVVRDLLEDFQLEWILLVGIAGALPTDDYSLGDVVVSSHIYDFCIEARLAGSEEFAVRGGPLNPKAASVVGSLSGRRDLPDWSSSRALGMARLGVGVDAIDERLYGSKKWQQKVRCSLSKNFANPRDPVLWVGPVGSSDKLVKNTELAKRWKTDHRDMAAVEMEAAGAYSAAHDKGAKLIVIRGISDVVGFVRDDNWTKFACETAAAFTHALLQSPALV